MIRRRNKLNSTDVLLRATQRTPILQDAIRSVVIQALQVMHPKAFNDGAPLNLLLSRRATLPGHIREKTPRTEVFPLPAAHADSGKTTGFSEAQRIIWQDYLKFKPSDQAFRERLYITVGDQKTAAYGRAAAHRYRDSVNPFAARNWQVVPPALWHVKLNFLRLIARTHLRSKPQLSSYTTMESDAESLRLRHPSDADKAEYKPTRRLVYKMWVARICMYLYNRLIEGGDLEKPQHQRELTQFQIDGVLETKCDKVEAAIEWVTDMLTAPETWNDDHDGLSPLNSEEVSTRRFMTEAAYFQVLDSAMRTGATDVIKDLLPRMAVLFYGAGKPLYGYEMLYLHWLLQPSTSDQPLQDAILAASLVPQYHNGAHFIGTDLMLEHHNKEYKLDIRNQKNSTHTILHTSDRVGTLSNILRRFQPALETAFGSPRSNPHHPDSHDIPALYNRAIFLLYTIANPRQLSPDNRPWVSKNIFKIGTSALLDKLQKFNYDREYGSLEAEVQEGLETAYELDAIHNGLGLSDSSSDDDL